MNCARGLEYGPRVQVEDYTQDRGHSFCLYMDRPRVANNVLIFFYAIAVTGPKMRGPYSGSKWEIWTLEHAWLAKQI